MYAFFFCMILHDLGVLCMRLYDLVYLLHIYLKSQVYVSDLYCITISSSSQRVVNFVVGFYVCNYVIVYIVALPFIIYVIICSLSLRCSFIFTVSFTCKHCCKHSCSQLLKVPSYKSPYPLLCSSLYFVSTS